MYTPPRHITGIAISLTVAFLYVIGSISARDPTSIFFNPRKGYAPHYSTVRRQEAQAFITSYNPANAIKAGVPSGRKLCIGIPTVKRDGEQYLQYTVGSLLAGLSPEERKEIYLIAFIAHSKPITHPAYSEAWLSALADEVITYPFGLDRMQYIVDMEKKSNFEEKGLFDYSFLLDKCAAQLTPYVAILEDDTLAVDGWYHRTLIAIQSAEQQAALQRAKPEFFYLRLFYTEEFLGWHRQYWFIYLLNCVCISSLPVIAILALQRLRPNTKYSVHLFNRRNLTVIYSTLAVIILIYFAVGRITVRPVSHGVHEMRRFGCCSQAMVFPNTKAVDLVKYFKERHVGYVDVLTEDFANERGELRYAVTPSLFQHIGRHTSQEDGYEPMSKWGLSVAQKIWSFGFERFDAEQLKNEREHRLKASQSMDVT